MPPRDPFPAPNVPVGHPKLLTSYGLFPGANIQVTSGTPDQARSESVIAVNPQNRYNLIGASKKFSDPNQYRFQIGVRVSMDGGKSWRDAVLPLLPEWSQGKGVPGEPPGMSDPALAFDAFGNAFMVGEPFRYVYTEPEPNDLPTIGMYVYKSTDGGLHWSFPVPLHVGDVNDDKSWIACDNNPASPYYGNIYVAWGAKSPLRFRRSGDHGASWKNFGNSDPSAPLAAFTDEPEISVGLDGTVHIAWLNGGTIEYMRSTDGGETFSAPKSIVTGVHSLQQYVQPNVDGFAEFPPAKFRVLTLTTCCGFGLDPFGQGRVRYFPGPHNFIVAWSDFREGVARIYYRTSSDGGVSFQGPEEGQALLGDRNVHPEFQHFHPQIVSTGSGVIGCAYYEYGPKTQGRYLIDVKMAASFDKGRTFPYTATVTDAPWDPNVDAPYSHRNENVTFIGDYFGLDADETGFAVLWTDTRTGVQELFYARVDTEKLEHPRILDGIAAEILVGIIGDGDGAVIVNGHIVRVPPRGPEHDLAQAMAALDAASKISGPPGDTLTRNVYGAIEAIAAEAGRSLGPA
jgi:hypothetical protein